MLDKNPVLFPLQRLRYQQGAPATILTPDDRPDDEEQCSSSPALILPHSSTPMARPPAAALINQPLITPGEDAAGVGGSEPQEIGRGVCQICGEEISSAVDHGDLFIACTACGFPVCRPCYEYERSEGNRACPHCKARYKRHKGSPRVEGDEDEGGNDDLDYEFSVQEGNNLQLTAEAMLHQHMSVGRAGENAHDNLSLEPTTEQPEQATTEYHAIIVPPSSSGGAAGGGGGGGGKRVHPFPYVEPGASPLPGSRRNFGSYGYGTVSWKQRLESWKARKEKYQMVAADESQVSREFTGDESAIVSELPLMDEARQPLSRKVPIPSSLINPYRLAIVIRLVVMGFFFRYRITRPVANAYALWLTSVICELWLAVAWILEQLPKWFPVRRETYLDRLALRYEREGEPSHLAPVDVYVSTVDPMKESPLVTANSILSILSVDYPVDKLSCYVSDDAAAMLTFECLSETSEFARKWVPFCKNYSIEPRAPEVYFAKKIDYLKDRVHPSFVKDRRIMKREYEEFKVRVNALVAKAEKVPEEGWSMQDGTPWPGNNIRDHPGMIQVFLGHSGGHDSEGNELPRLVYVSREKRPGFNHHKKAGAMNSLIRVSAVLTNAPFILNLDCNHYVNNSSALREAMCFMMDPAVGKKVCYVQFPHRFDGVDTHDRYANHNNVFFDINLKGLDGVQGPVYVGTGSVFRRQALYGYNAPVQDKTHKLSYNLFAALCCCSRRKKNKRKLKKSRRIESDPSIPPVISLQDIEKLADQDEYKFLVDQKTFERKYGQSSVFINSTLLENGGVPESSSPQILLKEAIHVISCGYEDKTEWGKEIGWIYGSVAEDMLTGFKMHARGWRSIYCNPETPAFKGSAPINLSDRLHQVLHWALGAMEVLLSRHCPIWYGHTGRLKWLQRLAYISSTVYPLTSIPLVVYCTLPAVCLLTGKFIIPQIGNLASLWFIAMFLSIVTTGILEMRWSKVGVEEWWRNEQFWVIGGVSSNLFAVFQGIVKRLSGIETSFTLASKTSEISELYAFKWTSLLVPPSTILVINIVGVAAGLSDAINNGYQSWGPLFGKLFFAFWVIVHLYPFLKGLMGKQNRTPTIVIVWSILLASIFSLLWVRINPFLARVVGPSLEDCGINC